MSQYLHGDYQPYVDEEAPPPRARAFLVVLTLMGLLGIVFATIQFTQQHLTTQASDCASIGNDASRLACYDAIAQHAPTQPARGANAPLP